MFRFSEIIILWHPIHIAVPDRKRKECQEIITIVWLPYVAPAPSYTETHVHHASIRRLVLYIS